MSFPRTSRSLVFSAGLLALSGCVTLEEDAVTKVPEISSFKEGGHEGVSPPNRWWTLFHDETLNDYAARIDCDNFALRAGLARIEQACAILGVSRAELVPNLNGSGSVQRNRVSENDSVGGFFNVYSTQYRGALAASWELDLWGRVRNAVKGAKADVKQVNALTADLRLSLQSQLARNYFTLRFLDEEIRVLRRAVVTREDNLALARKRFEGELTSELDVARAETELATTRAELARLDSPRAQLEHAIAVLVGEVPAKFTIPDEPLEFRLPRIRAGVPMEVLQNRPDVAAAIARLCAANARIGVSRAEFFPRIDLIASGGLSSIDSSRFFDWSSRTFTIGPEVTLPVFQGGRLRANLAGARAVQCEAVADYQQTVLDSFREVEDALSDLNALTREMEAQQLAVRASERSLFLSNKRYERGLVSSIEVIDAVREQLSAERRAVQIRGLQYDATIRLIQALGGGLCEKHTKEE